MEAGGLEILTDRIRSADESNPQGYYELERVKDLDKGGDPSWLEDARGKTVKIIAFLLRYLPENLNYRIIFMQRDLEEIVASQAKMLLQREEASETDDDRMIELFKQHLLRTRNLIMSHACFDVLEVRYSDVIRNPAEQTERVSRFLGGVPDVQSMANVVDPQLYRNRSRPGPR